MRNSSSNLPLIGCRGLLAIVGAVAASGVYCALVDLETTPFGLLVGLGTIPAITAFSLSEWLTGKKWARHLAYWLVTCGIASVLLVAYFKAPAHEGADQLVWFILESFAVATVCAYLCAVLAFPGTARADP